MLSTAPRGVEQKSNEQPHAKQIGDTSPLYLREGQTIAEGIDPARVIFIKRVLIDPPEREAEQLPEMELELSLSVSRREF